MKKDRRLTKADDFAAVRRAGRSYSDRLLVLLARRNDLHRTRVGFSVSKRVGNSVQRNKAKRRMRELLRLSPLLEGWDLVFVARRGVVSATPSNLSVSTSTLLSRAGVLPVPVVRK